MEFLGRRVTLVGSSILGGTIDLRPDWQKELEMTDETAETVCEAFKRLTGRNPRFIEAPRTGVIIGARPTAAAAADAGQTAPAAAQPRKTTEA